MHLQVADDLRARIAAGDWEVGATLPSEPELAGQYGVSRGTVNRSVVELRREGLVEVRRGVGTVVVAARPASVTLSASTLREWADTLDRRPGAYSQDAVDAVASEMRAVIGDDRV